MCKIKIIDRIIVSTDDSIIKKKINISKFRNIEIHDRPKYLSGDNYTIADIATWPWIARHKWHDIGLKNYKNLTRWYLEVSNREAVIKGYNFMKKGEPIPQP